MLNIGIAERAASRSVWPAAAIARDPFPKQPRWTRNGGYRLIAGYLSMNSRPNLDFLSLFDSVLMWTAVDLANSCHSSIKWSIQYNISRWGIRGGGFCLYSEHIDNQITVLNQGPPRIEKQW